LVATFWSSPTAPSSSSIALTIGSFDVDDATDDLDSLLLLLLVDTGDAIDGGVATGVLGNGGILTDGESVGVNGGVASLPLSFDARDGVVLATFTAVGRDGAIGTGVDVGGGALIFFSTNSLLSTLVSKPSDAAMLSKNTAYSSIQC
jgi:hypothetical protein